MASPLAVSQAPIILAGSIPSFVLRGCVEDPADLVGEAVVDVGAGAGLAMGLSVDEQAAAPLMSSASATAAYRVALVHVWVTAWGVRIN
ncbi:MAG: hypothetical protein M3460_22640 [Actinomycetota bacterium]|nr:hypothetical protein [Actinomycetota bacterium]